MGRVIALEEEMDRAGAFAFGGALHGPDAATVVRGGTGLDKVTTDGPFVEAKEHIGGFYIINAEDLDEALAWAEKVVEAINHDIEVRPFRATGRVQAGPTDGGRWMDDVERAFREAHGQAVATLTRLFGDITLAEDAVQDAFVTAVDRWPRDGVPDNPAGWIVTTARNRAVDVVRRNRRGRELTEEIASDRLRAETHRRLGDPEPMRDDQLRLVFTCCHPAIRVEHQVALTLRLDRGTHPVGGGLGVPGERGDHGETPGAGEVQDQGGAHPLSGARRRRTAGPAACGALGAVPDLQRGRRRRQPPRPASRGDPAHPACWST